MLTHKLTKVHDRISANKKPNQCSLKTNVLGNAAQRTLGLEHQRNRLSMGVNRQENVNQSSQLWRWARITLGASLNQSQALCSMCPHCKMTASEAS